MCSFILIVDVVVDVVVDAIFLPISLDIVYVLPLEFIYL